MKLIRFGELGKEKPGIMMNNKWYDLSSFCTDFNESFFEQNGLERLQSFLATNPLLPDNVAVPGLTPKTVAPLHSPEI